MNYKNILFAAGALVVLSGCAPANVSSNLRESSTTNGSMMTRCVTVDTEYAPEESKGQNNTQYSEAYLMSHPELRATSEAQTEVNKTLQKFDGWKLIYTSEYTTANKVTTAMTMCFEKPY